MLQTPPQATKTISASVQKAGIRQGTACGIPRRGTEQCPGGDISPDVAVPGSFTRAMGDSNGLDLQHLPLLIGGFSEPIRLQNINASNRQPHIPVLGPESFWAPRAPQLPPPCTCVGLHPPVSFHLAPAPKHPTVASTCVTSSPSSPRNFQQPWVLLNLSFAFKLNLRGHGGGCQAGDIPTSGMWADTEEMDGDPSIITPQQKETSNEAWRQTSQEEIHF